MTNLGPIGPRWTPCWPHEPCYQGCAHLIGFNISLLLIYMTNTEVYGIDIHYSDVIITAMASQISSLTIVYSTLYLSVDRRKHQSSASLAFVRGIHQWPVNFPHKGPVMRKIVPFDDVIMILPERLPGVQKWAISVISLHQRYSWW